MKALCWYGTRDVRVQQVPDPRILAQRDAIVRITSTAICGSDLHLYDGYKPTMEAGDILGHEFMGEVVEVGRDVKNLSVGDRVVVPFTIACGVCDYCQRELWSLCDNTNPNAWMMEKAVGATTSGLFGYSHMYGGYAGGQAEYARVPFADVGPIKVPEGVSDEQVLFLSDILPTGYQAAEQCDIAAGDIVAVWGCGPVGQFAIQSAYLLGAEKVIAIDRVPDRLRTARDVGGAETIDFDREDVYERLRELTGGRGPDACIDAVGLEAHATGSACRKGGTISVPGVYAGLLDKVPFGAAFAKGLTMRMGQTHVKRYMKPLLDRIVNGQIDPTRIITHRLPLDRAADGYQMFVDKADSCLKVVLKP
jgi:threonine dehydrogenase-like Zn-dependent dehydrogenase